MFNVQFLFLTSILYFQLSICTGQTSNEFPAFANTRTLYAIKTILTKPCQVNRFLKYFLILTCFLFFHFYDFAQTPNFSGTWVLNFQKSKLEDKNNGLTGQVFIIKQEGEKFSLKIIHIYGDKKRKIGYSMLADGKTRRMKIIFNGKLEKKENGLQATMWRKNYSNIVNYKFGTNQNELIADEIFTGRPKNHHSIWVFDREISK